MAYIVQHRGCSRLKNPILSSSNSENFNFIILFLPSYWMPFPSPFLIIHLFLVSANKNFTAPNISLVNEPDLNKILRSEIFLHKDGQLRAAHIILEYKPISSSFQSPKNVIKTKDPRLHLIDVAISGFLIEPPPEGTHQMELLDQRTAVRKWFLLTRHKKKKWSEYLKW